MGRGLRIITYSHGVPRWGGPSLQLDFSAHRTQVQNLGLSPPRLSLNSLSSLVVGHLGVSGRRDKTTPRLGSEPESPMLARAATVPSQQWQNGCAQACGPLTSAHVWPLHSCKVDRKWVSETSKGNEVSPLLKKQTKPTGNNGYSQSLMKVN